MHAHGHWRAHREGRPNLNGRTYIVGILVFLVVPASGLFRTINGPVGDINAANTPPLALGAFGLPGIARLIALRFEFVDGFHDTAIAVPTVICTHSLQPQVAIIY